MKEFALKFYSADKVVYEGKCISVKVPLEDGFLEILADHSNMVGEIFAGEVTVKTLEGSSVFAVFEGMVKVEYGKVLILVDTAESLEEIDEKRAERALENAQTTLQKKQSFVHFKQLEAQLARAANRLKVKQRRM